MMGRRLKFCTHLYTFLAPHYLQGGLYTSQVVFQAFFSAASTAMTMVLIFADFQPKHQSISILIQAAGCSLDDVVTVFHDLSGEWRWRLHASWEEGDNPKKLVTFFLAWLVCSTCFFYCDVSIGGRLHRRRFIVLALDLTLWT